MSDLTQIISAVERGEASAAEELLPLVYAELRHLAAQKLSREKPRQTLQAIALLHEAWLRLAGAEQEGNKPRWDGRRHFFDARSADSLRGAVGRPLELRTEVVNDSSLEP